MSCKKSWCTFLYKAKKLPALTHACHGTLHTTDSRPHSPGSFSPTSTPRSHLSVISRMLSPPQAPRAAHTRGHHQPPNIICYARPPVLEGLECPQHEEKESLSDLHGQVCIAGKVMSYACIIETKQALGRVWYRGSCHCMRVCLLQYTSLHASSASTHHWHEIILAWYAVSTCSGTTLWHKKVFVC